MKPVAIVTGTARGIGSAIADALDYYTKIGAEKKGGKKLLP